MRGSLHECGRASSLDLGIQPDIAFQILGHPLCSEIILGEPLLHHPLKFGQRPRIRLRPDIVAAIRARIDLGAHRWLRELRVVHICDGMRVEWRVEMGEVELDVMDGRLLVFRFALQELSGQRPPDTAKVRVNDGAREVGVQRGHVRVVW